MKRLVKVQTIRSYKLSMSTAILQASLHRLQYGFMVNDFFSISDNRKSTLLDGRISKAWQRHMEENGECMYGKPGVLGMLLFRRGLMETWLDR